MSTKTLNWRGFLDSDGDGWINNARADVSAACSSALRWLDSENSVTIHAEKLNEIVHNAPLRATLRLPAHHALVKTIVLPMSAQKHLASIVENKIRQLTPFEPRDVYFGYQRVGGGGKEFRVQIIAAPKQACQPFLSAARDRSIAVDGITVESAEEVNILPPEERENAQSTQVIQKLLKINGLLLAAMAALIFIGGGLRYGLAHWQAQQAAGAVTEVIQMRRDVQKIVAGSRGLSEHLNAAPDVPLLMNTLAAAIDESAWLDRVTISGETVEIQGYAENAAEILFVVDELPQFSDAGFKSAISRDSKSGKERFQIRATITGAS